MSRIASTTEPGASADPVSARPVTTDEPRTVDPRQWMVDAIAGCPMIPAAERAASAIEDDAGDVWTIRFIALVAGLDPLAQGVPSTIEVIASAVDAPRGVDAFLSALCSTTLAQASIADRRDIDAVRMHIVNAVLFGDIIRCARAGRLSDCASWTSLVTVNEERTVVATLRSYFEDAPKVRASKRERREDAPKVRASKRGDAPRTRAARREAADASSTAESPVDEVTGGERRPDAAAARRRFLWRSGATSPLTRSMPRRTTSGLTASADGERRSTSPERVVGDDRDVAIPRKAARAAIHLFGEGRWMTPQQQRAATVLRSILEERLRDES